MKNKVIAILIGTSLVSFLGITNVYATENVTTQEFTQEEINGDGEMIPLTEVEVKLTEKKIKEAEEYNSKNINKRYSHINSVGNYKQTKDYTCGPATARNIINGYVYNHGGYVPSESTLASALGTTSNGTNFGNNWISVMNKYAPGNNYIISEGWRYSRWTSHLQTAVPYVIEKSKNYGMVANINHGQTESGNVIHPHYANKRTAHYVAVHGYEGNSNVFISDSNNKMSGNRMYKTSYYKLGYSTKARGVIW